MRPWRGLHSTKEMYAAVVEQGKRPYSEAKEMLRRVLPRGLLSLLFKCFDHNALARPTPSAILRALYRSDPRSSLGAVD